MSAPSYRYLRGYSLDPGFSTRLVTAGINEVVYQVPFEHLAPGPVGEYLEVMDFDPASGSWYEPVDLGAEEVASQNGLAPSEGNPQFHQQLCYAVGMKTIRHFERALGRKIVWPPRVRRRPRRAGEARDLEWSRTYVQRLRIYPHAIRDANAYYDPEKAALLFGYFTAAEQTQGANYPGGVVFTCLSPDIVAHETTHAILDSIHHRYIEDTNPDVAAFHEGFADIVALLQRFTFRELVEHQLGATGGRLDGPTVLGQLATQFGEALEGNRGALRTMIGRWTEDRQWVPLEPSPSDYTDNTETHLRGAVLVATIFDAFVRLYRHRTADLLRIATNGTAKPLAEGAINADLVRRLAAEACQIAEHLLHICIRALDYCPPTDIKFGTYFRALITADIDIAPEDEGGFRVALIEAFRARGIYPSRVNTLSAESLCWDRPDFTARQLKTLSLITQQIRPDITALVETTDRKELYLRSMAAQRNLNRFLMRDVRSYHQDEREEFLNLLGLTWRPVSELFDKRARDVRFLRDGKPDPGHTPPPIECHTVRPAFRTGREGRQIEQVLITLTQRVTADVGEPGAPRPMVFRGGCSLILSLGEMNRAEYVIVKNIKSYRRFRDQAKYFSGEEAGGARRESMYAEYDRDWRINFNLLHGRMS